MVHSLWTYSWKDPTFFTGSWEEEDGDGAEEVAGREHDATVNDAELGEWVSECTPTLAPPSLSVHRVPATCSAGCRASAKVVMGTPLNPS
jgi:hypothetical protein